WCRYLAPRKSAEATVARASLCGRTSGSSCRITPTCPTRCSRTGPTRPFFTPETRTGSPSFRPLTFLKTTLIATVLATSERPVSQTIKHVGVHRVEPRGRLVVQEILRLPRDGARDPHALFHPARQLRRILPGHVELQVHEPQAFLHAVVAKLLVVVARLVRDPKADVLGHGHGVEQRAVLEYVADFRTQL